LFLNEIQRDQNSIEKLPAISAIRVGCVKKFTNNKVFKKTEG